MAFPTYDFLYTDTRTTGSIYLVHYMIFVSKEKLLKKKVITNIIIDHFYTIKHPQTRIRKKRVYR